jgi:hypothetical protein
MHGPNRKFISSFLERIKLIFNVQSLCICCICVVISFRIINFGSTFSSSTARTEQGEQIYLPGEFELSLFRTLTAKCGEHSTVDIENLNSMIVGIRHDDSVSTGYSYVMRVF